MHALTKALSNIELLSFASTPRILPSSNGPTSILEPITFNPGHTSRSRLVSKVERRITPSYVDGVHMAPVLGRRLVSLDKLFTMLHKQSEKYYFAGPLIGSTTSENSRGRESLCFCSMS
jgi:hypothetical protein